MNRLVFGLGSIHHVTKECGFDLLNTAYDNGIRFFDTADLYGNGYANALLNEWLVRFKRFDIIIIAKSGLCYSNLLRCKFRIYFFIITLLYKLKILKIKETHLVHSLFDNRVKIIRLWHERNALIDNNEFNGYAGYNLPSFVNNKFLFLQGFVEDKNSYKYDCVFGLMKSVNFNLDDFAEYYHENITQKILFSSTNTQHLISLIKAVKVH
jgi:hypothetical protein